MVTNPRERLKTIDSFPSLVKFLRDDLEWPIQDEPLEELVFDYTPEELGIDPKNAAKINYIKRFRPLVPNQPWGIFFVMFEPKKLPVVALRRILNQLVVKKRELSDREGWKTDDLLFISNYGETDHRQITFANFSYSNPGSLPSLKVLSWDNRDTDSHLDYTARILREQLSWADDYEYDFNDWRKSWRDAFTIEHREPIDTSLDLAKRLAGLARDIRGWINSALEVETSSGPLTKLKKAFQSALIHDLTDKDFADMYAQTIAYGLLSARIAQRTGEGDALVSSIPVTNPFIKELLENFLNTSNNGNSVQGITVNFDELGVNEIIDALDRSNMEAVIRDFGDKNPLEDPVIYFYELFLEEYDKEQKVRRGVFYTPRPVVAYIVRSVDELLRTRFGLADGLADTTSWGEITSLRKDLPLPSGVSHGEDFIQILDPAVGTGTFLVEVIDLIYKTLTIKWTAEGHSTKKINELWNEYVPKHLLTRLYGYELLMAPYVIAHLKIGLKLQETGYRFSNKERAHIYLSNALEPSVNYKEQMSFAIPALAQESKAVNEVKKDRRFTVLIGNPPYSNFGQLNRGNWVMNQLKEYKKGLRERKLNLDDDYIKFIRLAQFLIDHTGCGVIGLITANSYLDGVTHRRMRYSLQKSNDFIRVINLHGNIRRKETTLDNRKDENVFRDIMQGVAILVMGKSSSDHFQRKVEYTDLWGLAADKIVKLQHDEFEWSSLIPKSDLFLLIPWDSKLSEEYHEFPSLMELFREIGQGIQTKRDSVAIRFSEIDLNTVLLDLRKLEESEFSLKYGIPAVSASWSIESAKQDVLENSGQILQLMIRPFDIRWTYFTGKTNGFHARPRRPSTQNMLQSNWALVAKRQTKEADFSSIWVVDKPINEGFFSIDPRGRETLFPFKVMSNDPIGLFANESEQVSSINLVRERIPDHLQSSDDEQLFAFIYGILHSSEYRNRYSELLKTDYPHVPFPKTVIPLNAIAKVGKELISRHIGFSTRQPLNTEFPVSGNRNPIVNARVKYDNEKIRLSDDSVIEQVHQRIWDYQIGGYRICQKWLKDRKDHRLSDVEMTAYRSMLVVIADTLRLTGDIDQIISECHGWDQLFL